jgi:hypothetical protein
VQPTQNSLNNRAGCPVLLSAVISVTSIPLKGSWKLSACFSSQKPPHESCYSSGMTVANIQHFILLGTILAGVIWQRVDYHQLSGRLDRISDDMKNFYRDPS